VHFERLVIEAGDATFRLALHPRLTVIAGAGQLERDGLVGELLTALGPGRDGVHAELVTDAGTRLALFRPPGGRHRMVDVERSLDVTHRWTDAAGRLDPLGRAGLSMLGARRMLRLTQADLSATSRHDELVQRLGHVDQARLWDVAGKVADRERHALELAEATGGVLDDDRMIAEIERRHAEFETAQADLERVRSVTFSVAAGTGLMVLPLAALAGALAAAPFALAAIGATGVSTWWWQRAEAARRAETEALRAAGADSYLAFSLHRVNGLVVSDHQRRALLQARDAHRAALAEWHLLAGDVPLEWALEHREEIRRTAVELRRAAGVSSPMASHLTAQQSATATLAPVLESRLAEARQAGPGGESLPLLLDDPLIGLSAEAKQPLLDLLSRASAGQQLVYLTEDDDVIGWARLEQLGGQMAVVEPATADDGDRARRRGRHVAA
jgi:hypothetical protein